jgi:hypothetical protein
VLTPFGTGEVRYVSESGQDAAIRLDGGSRQEVWLPVARISRPRPRCARLRSRAASAFPGRLGPT